jgi:hypothetical protein
MRPDVGRQAQFKKRKPRATYAYDSSLSPALVWAGKAERQSFDVPTLPLFVHERLSTKAILETLKGHKRDRTEQFSLFGNPQHSITDQVLERASVAMEATCPDRATAFRYRRAHEPAKSSPKSIARARSRLAPSANADPCVAASMALVVSALEHMTEKEIRRVYGGMAPEDAPAYTIADAARFLHLPTPRSDSGLAEASIQPRREQRRRHQ